MLVPRAIHRDKDRGDAYLLLPCGGDAFVGFVVS